MWSRFEVEEMYDEYLYDNGLTVKDMTIEEFYEKVLSEN